VKTTTTMNADIVFLIDVDNTLLDNDRIIADLREHVGVAQGWDRYIGQHGDMIGIGQFGASAPAKVLLEKYGFSVDNVVARAKKLLDLARLA
jgi:transketolase